MTYVLEEIQKDDIQKILNEAQCNSDALRSLNYSIQGQLFSADGRNWAIDKEKNSYLFRHGGNRDLDCYHFFFQKNVYELRKNSREIYGKALIYFNPCHPPVLSAEQLSFLQQAIKEAFDVYGPWGISDPDISIRVYFENEV